MIGFGKKNAFVAPQLGDRVKDPITGFAGIVTSVTHFLHGCIRVGVQPESLHEGKPLEDRYFDQSQLVVTEKAVHQAMILTVGPVPQPAEHRSPGGPARESAGFRR